VPSDTPFDVRPEDGFKTLSELERELRQYHNRIARLTLLRDNLVPAERYVLGRRDLRLAELISNDPSELSDPYEESGADDRPSETVRPVSG
jgi:hypothetical protein